MARLSIPTPDVGWGFFYRLPSPASSRPPDHRHADISGHAQGAPGRSPWYPCLCVRLLRVTFMCAVWRRERCRPLRVGVR
jgi:hypothetical protein